MPSTPQSSLRTRNLVVGLVVAVAVVILVVFWARDSLFGPRDDRTQPADTLMVTAEGAPDPGGAPDGTSGTPPERRWTEAIGVAPEWPASFEAPGCAEVKKEMERFCAALDDRPKLRVAGEGSPCDFLREAIRDLASRPPEASAELRSHDATVANVFHLFRVLGSERMALLAGLLSEERDLAEPGALAFYRWWISRGECEDDPGAGTTALYDYAGFVFNSIGGQAYLRRRSPHMEAIVCFYALHALDVAIERGHNPHGIDPTPEIGRCAALVETQPLVFSARYGEVLDDMARRWNAKGLPE